jgi:hypothetical protein
VPPLRSFEPQFEREHGCTEAEWLSWLPGAVRDHRLSLLAPGQATVHIGSGALFLSWQVLTPRRIALISMPRMTAQYRFEGTDADTRNRFMQYFDLYMQRGGG